MWAFPGLLAFTAAGLGVATRLVAREDPALERGLFRAGAGLFLLLGLLSTARFAAVYAEMGGETWRREIPLAAWIRANLPPGVAIANAATSVEYLTGHRNLNLHGVTSPDFVGNRTAEREAGVFESLERLPSSERPGFLLLTRSGYEGSELLRALADGPPLFETASFGDDLLLFRARWDILDRGREPVLAEAKRAVGALQEVDRLDVCDAARRGGPRLPLPVAAGRDPPRRLRGHRPRAPADGRDDARRRRPAHRGRRVVPRAHPRWARARGGAPLADTRGGERDASAGKPLDAGRGARDGDPPARGREGGGAPRAAQPAGLERARLPRAARRPSPTGRPSSRSRAATRPSTTGSTNERHRSRRPRRTRSWTRSAGSTRSTTRASRPRAGGTATTTTT